MEELEPVGHRQGRGEQDLLGDEMLHARDGGGHCAISADLHDGVDLAVVVVYAVEGVEVQGVGGRCEAVFFSSASVAAVLAVTEASSRLPGSRGARACG